MFACVSRRMNQGVRAQTANKRCYNVEQERKNSSIFTKQARSCVPEDSRLARATEYPSIYQLYGGCAWRKGK